MCQQPAANQQTLHTAQEKRRRGRWRAFPLWNMNGSSSCKVTFSIMKCELLGDVISALNFIAWISFLGCLEPADNRPMNYLLVYFMKRQSTQWNLTYCPTRANSPPPPLLFYANTQKSSHMSAYISRGRDLRPKSRTLESSRDEDDWMESSKLFTEQLVVVTESRVDGAVRLWAVESGSVTAGRRLVRKQEGWKWSWTDLV